MNEAVVIIPTTGSPELEDAISSVINQTIRSDILVVFDGKQFDRPLRIPVDERVIKVVFPFNTATARTNIIDRNLPRHWYGARAMISAAYIVNNDYAMVLDQDNFLEPNHIESHISTLNSAASAECQVTYSLRNIYRKDKTFVCRDDCESLGKHKGASGYLIDTSCYFYRTDFLMQTAHLWLWGWGSDRVYLDRIRSLFGDQIITGTGRYTLNYRLGGNEGSVKEDFFLFHNKKAYDRFEGGMPWAVE